MPGRIDSFQRACYPNILQEIGIFTQYFLNLSTSLGQTWTSDTIIIL